MRESNKTVFPPPLGMVKAVFGALVQEVWDPNTIKTGSDLVGRITGANLGAVLTPTLSYVNGRKAGNTAVAGARYRQNATYTLSPTGSRPCFLCVGQLRSTGTNRTMVAVNTSTDVPQRLLTNTAGKIRFSTLLASYDYPEDTALHNFLYGNDGSAGAFFQMDSLTALTGPTDTAALLVDASRIGVGTIGGGSLSDFTVALLVQFSGLPTAAQYSAWKLYAHVYWNTPL